jgi:hypothetical protein
MCECMMHTLQRHAQPQARRAHGYAIALITYQKCHVSLSIKKREQNIMGTRKGREVGPPGEMVRDCRPWTMVGYLVHLLNVPVGCLNTAGRSCGVWTNPWPWFRSLF